MRASSTLLTRAVDAVVAWAADADHDVDTTLAAVAAAIAACDPSSPAIGDGPALADDALDAVAAVAQAHTAGTAPGADPLAAPHPAHLLGAVYERLLHPGARRARGAHFTPPDVAARLVAFALDGVAFDGIAFDVALDDHEWRMCDPACGGGVFLLACAEHLVARGWSRLGAARAVHGVDIDARSVWVSATALELWAPGCDATRRVRQGDALHDALPWPSFDAVIGNPPFQNQLQTATARGPEARAAVAARGGTPAAYVDSAALFVARGLDLVHAGGRVALVQPHSTLVARDATGVRAEATERADLVGLWFAPEPIFAASVRVCAPVLERRAAPASAAAAPAPRPAVRRACGRSFAPAADVPAPSSSASWAPLASDLLGVPRVRLPVGARLGDLATATAGFRDEYYGLVGAVREAAVREAAVREAAGHDAAAREPVPGGGASPVGDRRLRQGEALLVTCGLIDVLGCRWGERVVRFARVRYDAPVVDLDALDGRVAAWVRAQLVPKVLVATQSKVVEVVVDEHGCCVPSTPVIAVHAPADQLWRIAAALSAPCISAHALAQVAGAALSLGAIKLAARQVLDLPLPVDEAMWARGGALAETAQQATGAARIEALDELGRTMDAAYGSSDPAVFAWWRERRGEP